MDIVQKLFGIGTTDISWTHDDILGMMSYPHDDNICFVRDSSVCDVYVIFVHTILIKYIFKIQLHIKVLNNADVYCYM